MGPPDPLRCSERYADDLGGHDAAVIDKLLVSLTATDTASAWLDNKSPRWLVASEKLLEPKFFLVLVRLVLKKHDCAMTFIE